MTLHEMQLYNRELIRLNSELISAKERTTEMERQCAELAATLREMQSIVRHMKVRRHAQPNEMYTLVDKLIKLDKTDCYTILAAHVKTWLRVGAKAMVGYMEMNELIDQDQIEAGELIERIEKGEISL